MELKYKIRLSYERQIVVKGILMKLVSNSFIHCGLGNKVIILPLFFIVLKK